MRSVQDALYNWLSIKVVCDARPEDTAARETLDLFDEIIKNEQHLSNVEVTTDDVMYYVTYIHEGESKKTRFPRELIAEYKTHDNDTGSAEVQIAVINESIKN
jgi:hypothetical protein